MLVVVAVLVVASVLVAVLVVASVVTSVLLVVASVLVVASMLVVASVLVEVLVLVLVLLLEVACQHAGTSPVAVGKYLLRVRMGRWPVAAHTGTGVAAARREVPGVRTSTGRNGAVGDSMVAVQVPLPTIL